MTDAPQLPDFDFESALGMLPDATATEEELEVTLQSIASGSLKALHEIITAPDLDPDDGRYTFEKGHKLKAIEVGLRTIGKHEENILRKQQIDVIPILLERIAKEEARLLSQQSGGESALLSLAVLPG